jgi:hypothetical protein
MCIFSRAVSSVSSTKIFARGEPDGRQHLVYSMSLDVREPLAMVLPLPVADARLEFVNLDRYRDFFADMQKGFPEPKRSHGLLAPASQSSSGVLPVFDVGDYVASLVPARADFARLDPRFRVTETLFESKPEYDDFSFAVFQLKPLREQQTVHPMALTFARRDARALFFPTVHVHDGTVPARAQLDHALYCQSDDEVLTRTFAWRESEKPAKKFMRIGRTHGLVSADLKAYLWRLWGDYPNVDIVVRAPRCKRSSLDARSELFALRMSALSAFTLVVDERTRRAHRIASEQLDELHDRLMAALVALTAAQRDAWGLVPLRDEIPARWLANDEVGGTSALHLAMGVPSVEVAHACRVEIPAERDGHDTQMVQLAFARAPVKERVVEIRAALSSLLARVIGEMSGAS